MKMKVLKRNSENECEYCNNKAVFTVQQYIPGGQFYILCDEHAKEILNVEKLEIGQFVIIH